MQRGGYQKLLIPPFGDGSWYTSERIRDGRYLDICSDTRRIPASHSDFWRTETDSQTAHLLSVKIPGLLFILIEAV